MSLSSDPLDKANTIINTFIYIYILKSFDKGNILNYRNINL